MDISEFIAKPTPRKLTIDSEHIVKEYGEPLEFHILLPLPVETYSRLTTLSKAEFVTEMLVTKDGAKLVKDGLTLEGSFISEVNDKIWIELGKLPGRIQTTNQ